MSFTESISTCFRKYIVFSGRAQRSEYWWFFLFTFAISVVLGIIAAFASALQFLEWVFSLAVLLPSLAVTARRLHDTNRSAWWLLIWLGIILGWIIGFIAIAISVAIDDPELLEAEPEEWAGAFAFIIIWGVVSVAGGITMLILCALPGSRGPNRYGPDPLQPDAGTGGYGYYQAPGHPYSPPPMGSYGESPYDATPPDSPPEPEGRRFCHQCGAQLQPEARFCTACGAAV